MWFVDGVAANENTRLYWRVVANRDGEGSLYVDRRYQAL
jgi:hypothetical protein